MLSELGVGLMPAFYDILADLFGPVVVEAVKDAFEVSRQSLMVFFSDFA